MRKVSLLFGSFIICLFFVAPLSGQTSGSEILGVYKYVLADREGMSMISPNHFIWILTDKNRENLSDEPSVGQKAKAYSEINCAAGTWEVVGERRYRFTFTYHSNANAIGNSFEWELDNFEGDLCNFYTLQQDGSRDPLSQSIKIADWGGSGSCSKYNGSWVYEGFDGFYMQSGIYGAWIILNDRVTDRSTTEGKAEAFDAVNSVFAVGDCLQGGKDFWNVLHAADIREERALLGSKASPIDGAEYLAWKLLNNKGKATGVNWKTRRVEK